MLSPRQSLLYVTKFLRLNRGADSMAQISVLSAHGHRWPTSRTHSNIDRQVKSGAVELR
jgi:hypothetical protein